MRGPTQNLGPIGLAVLTYVYRIQTNRQTDRHPDNYIHRFDRPLSSKEIKDGKIYVVLSFTSNSRNLIYSLFARFLIMHRFWLYTFKNNDVDYIAWLNVT